MRWCLVWLVLAGCGGPARATRPGSLVGRSPAPGVAPSCQDLHAGAARACAIATFDADAGVVSVVVRVEPEALPAARARVEVRCAEQTLDLGAVEEAAEVRCDVPLTSRVAPGESFRHAAGWHLAGRTFVPALLVDGAALEVPATLSLDVGDAPLYSSAGPGARVFDAPSFARLAEESFEVGPIAFTRREVVGDTLWIGGTGRADGELEVAADAIAGSYLELVEALGPGPADSLLIVIHQPDGAPWGIRAGSTIVWALPASEDPEVAIAGALDPLVAAFLPSSEPWLARGVVGYLAARLGAEQLGFPRDAVARQVFRLATAEDPAPGLVASFCLDGALAERDRSLAGALRAARGGAALTSDGLLSDLAAVSPATASHLAALLEGEAAIAPCLERAGLRVDEEGLEAPSEEAHRDALGVEAWEPAAGLPALRVAAAAEGSPLRGGDLLLAVADQAVVTPDDVALALRGLAAGAPVALEVRRRGERQRVDWTLPDLAGVEVVTRDVVRLVPIEVAAP